MNRLLAIAAAASILLILLMANRNGRRNQQTQRPPPVVAPDDETTIPRGAARFAAASPLTNEAFGARIARLLNGESEEHRLSMVEVNEYLARNRESGFSLVAAFGVSRDREYLKRAATNSPNDPFVQTQVLLHNVFPEERQKWIDSLKKSSPENSLPHFLSASDLMTSGDVAGALEEVRAAQGKSFDDFTKEMGFAQEEAYLSAGRNPAEAKALGNSEVLLPQLAPFKKFAVDLAEKAGEFGNAGDSAAQQALLSAAWELGHQLSVSGREGTLLHGLVGLAVENIALNKWPEGVDAPFLDRSVPEQRERNREIRANIREVSPVAGRWLPTASENEVIAYYDRLRMFGEWETLKWLRLQHPELVD